MEHPISIIKKINNNNKKKKKKKKKTKKKKKKTRIYKLERLSKEETTSP